MTEGFPGFSDGREVRRTLIRGCVEGGILKGKNGDKQFCWMNSMLEFHSCANLSRVPPSTVVLLSGVQDRKREWRQASPPQPLKGEKYGFL